MVRQRTTRFSSKPKPDSVSIATQVIIPRVTAPTVTSRTTRATRFTPTPTPRPTPRPTVVVSRPTVRTTRITRVTPRPPPPRDDFDRSLSPFPVVRQAFAEEAPTTVERSSLLITKKPRSRLITKPRARGFGFVPVRATPKDDIARVVTPLPTKSTVQKPKFSVPFETQQQANQRLLDLGAPTLLQAQRRQGLSELQIQIGAFGGGVNQEIENLGSIAGLGKARPEVGSLAIDLPFAVLGETFTRPSAKGEAGVLGLGFDFRSTPDFEAGFKKSGEIQEEIGKKFKKDPARAVGSIFAVASIEAGLLITTGGVGNLARRGIFQVGKQISKTKSFKIAQKVAQKQPDAKRGVPQLLIDIGDGRFALAQGREEIIKRGFLLEGADAIVTKISRKGVATVTKIPLIKNVVTSARGRGQARGRTVRIPIDESKTTDVPLIIIDTKKRLVKDAVTGQVTRQKPKTFFFNKNIPDRAKFLDNPELLTIRGAFQEPVDLSIRQIKKTGLRQVKGRVFGLTGKPTKAELKRTAEAEKLGQLSISGRGIVVETADASKGGIGDLIGRFAVAQKPLRRGQLPKLSGAEIQGNVPRLTSEQLKSSFKINKIRARQQALADKNVDQVLKIKGVKFLNEIPTKKLSPKESKKIRQLEEAFRIKNNKLTNEVRALVKKIPKTRATRQRPRARESEQIPFASVEVFQAKTVGGLTLSRSIRPRKEFVKIKGKKGQTKRQREIAQARAREEVRAKARGDDFAVLNPFGTTSRGISKGISTSKGGLKTVQKPKPIKRITETEEIFDQFFTPATKFRPVRAGLGTRVGTRVAVGSIQTQVRIPTRRVKDDFAIIQGEVIGQLPRQRQRQGQVVDQGSRFFGEIPTRTAQTPILERTTTTPFFREGVKPPRTRTGRIPVPFPPTNIFNPVPPPPRPPAVTGGGLPPFLPFGEEERRKERRRRARRKSKLGGRLFDIADEPFGEVAVGLGFFVETRRGESSIEEALGIGEFGDDEPITRQEKQARARLGRNGKRKRRDEFDFFG